ncbi:MAG: peptide chain release factor N(5)-glutamine methyltransferase [Solirubrobacteraceae bacterium]
MAETTGVAATSVSEAVAWGRRRLDGAGTDTPRLDAEVLLAFVLGVDRARLVIDSAFRLAAPQLDRFRGLVERRAAHEPVAYILGRRDFRYLTLTVDRRVLIPRPETELLVEVGLTVGAGARVLDVGTGSGAVALALKQERPDLIVSGVDVSPDALAVARANGLALGLDVQFVVSDLLEGVGGGFDAVLANLPYVASGAPLPLDVADYEPGLALYAGADGLDVVRRLVSEVGEMSPRPALLALEIGPEQAASVSGLVAGVGFASVEMRRDLAGLERVVVGRA